MQRVPSGSMLAVRTGIEAIEASLPGGVSVAAINSPKVTTLSGPTPDLEKLKETLELRGISCQFLPTSHAFHSPMMEPIMGDVAAKAAALQARAPVLPWVSTCTGDWFDRELAPQAGYWARQLREPVLFGKAVKTALDHGVTTFLEVGPGQALSQLVRQNSAGLSVTTLPSLGQPQRSLSDEDIITGSLGRLWLAGFEADWDAYHQGAKRLRVPLPTYSFDRKSYWVPAPHQNKPSARACDALEPALESVTYPTGPPAAAGDDRVPAELSGKETRIETGYSAETDVCQLIGTQLKVISRQIELLKRLGLAQDAQESEGGSAPRV